MNYLLPIANFTTRYYSEADQNHSLSYYAHTIPAPPYDYKQQANNDSPKNNIFKGTLG